MPQLISPLAFWLLLAVLAAAFGTDLIVWLRRGVHAIDLDGDTLLLRRGHQRTVQRIELASVRSVRSRRSWGGQAVEIVLHGQGAQAPAGTIARLSARVLSRLARSDRVVLRDDAFDRDAFRTLADRLGGWTTGKE